jgi:alginate O-acetyltransferase complex protein AlgJ
MRLFHLCPAFWAIPTMVLAQMPTPGPLSENQKDLRAEFAKRFQAAEKQGARVITGADGWLFLPSEVRFLSVGKFWGEDASKVSRAQKSDQADPLPAILNFRDQLKQRGIELLLVPVPPKAAVYPEKILSEFNGRREDATRFLHLFYEELRSHDVDVLDLSALFIEKRQGEHGAAFCQTDTHWSGAGCATAGQQIAEKVRSKLGLPVNRDKYSAEWKEIQISGDLVTLLRSDVQKPAREKLQIRAVTDKATAKPIQSDPNSSVLLLGDSHTLVYHEFHAENAGLADQIAENLGFAPEWIGTRGSGASTVRSDLYRRSRHNPGYLSKKKIIIWCFAAREFTEADAWAQLPVAP